MKPLTINQFRRTLDERFLIGDTEYFATQRPDGLWELVQGNDKKGVCKNKTLCIKLAQQLSSGKYLSVQYL